MTNQSREAFEREAFEKWSGNGPEIAPGQGYGISELNYAWEAWQAALSEGRRQGIEEAAKQNCYSCSHEAPKGITKSRAKSGDHLCRDEYGGKWEIPCSGKAIRALIVGGGEG